MSSDDEFSLDMSEDENMPSLANRLKAKAGAKPTKSGKENKQAKSKKKVIVESEDDDDEFDMEVSAVDDTKKNRRTSMERAHLSTKYQKKSQYEHIILRPDTYIGSTEKYQEIMWVVENEKLSFRQVTYVPGLYKIFDEILVNASDNKQRDASMKTIKVTIDSDSGSISVWNDGKGIPVEVHAEHGVYIPELIFGHLMTGENFEDTEMRVVGGRNGYGAKLTNIFSKEFTVETNDTRSGKRYKQRWSENMSVKEEPKITKATGKDFTCVTFTPDYARFGMPDGLDNDTLALLTKRVYDTAAITDKSVKVHLNGKPAPINNFEQYVRMFLDSKKPVGKEEEEESEEVSDDDDENSDCNSSSKKKKTAKKKSSGKFPGIYEKINDRWEVCIAPSLDGQAQQVSYVNGISTMRGGMHVQYIADQISQRLQTTLKKKQKGSDFKPHQIKSHLWIFVNALIVNPSFDSQTKDTLTTKSSKFGPNEFLPKLSDKTFKQIEKSQIVENILYWAKAKEMRDLSRKAGAVKKIKISGVDKLDDANNAGGKHSEKCTLILTEGDSAKTLAISGLSVVGRDNFGVFPLRGKLLNVRDAATTQIMKNEEIKAIMKIMGLQPGKDYKDTKSLRYGHLLIMTDQDHDGSHIKGLLMNFIHHFWPGLLAVPGFLQVFITPIVKVTKDSRVREFYTMPEYEKWTEELPASEQRRWTVKYYKGLGTSTAKEAKAYFANIKKHRIDMAWEGDDAGDALDMAFSKKRVNDRKDWLNDFEPGTFMDYNVNSIHYKTFVNNELILFSMADNARSIPSVVDGLKPSQRKVLFACFKRKLKNDIKVAQLVGYVSEHSAYHHGEASLASTVIGMAQTYVGSNNVNLLYPSGQFGSRLLGGKDAASPRYIFTRLSALARHVFHASDDALLNYLVDDGVSIEPDFYVPVIPFLLVNGSSGIGTGWSTEIPSYNPRDLIDYIRRKMSGQVPEHLMQPWYKGFDGIIEPEMHATKGFSGRYKVYGSFERNDADETITITELPVGSWTQSYKQFLMDDKSFPDGWIKDIRENHTDTKVHFTLFLSNEAYKSVASDDVLRKKLRLETTISTSNMHAYSSENVIKKYEAPEDILDEFFDYRLHLYAKRKEHLLHVLRSEWSKLDNRARFIRMVIDGELIVTKRKKAELLNELKAKGFDLFLKENSPIMNAEDAELDVEETSDSSPTAVLAKGYDYLLSMQIWTLTLERAQELDAQRDKKRTELDELAGKRPSDLWEEDLNALEASLNEQDKIDLADSTLEAKQRSGAGRSISQTTVVPRAQIKVPRKKPTQTIDLKEEPPTEPSRTKPVATKATSKSKPAGARQTKSKAVVKDESDSDVEILSLSERLKMRMMVSPSPAKKKPAKKRIKEATPIKVDASPSMELIAPDSETPKRKPASKKQRVKSSQKAPLVQLDSTESSKAPSPKAAARTSRNTRKPVKYIESSEEEDDEDFVLHDDDDDAEEASEASDFDESEFSE